MENQLEEGKTYTLAQLQEYIANNKDVLVLSEKHIDFGFGALKPKEFVISKTGYGASGMCKTPSQQSFSAFTRLTVYYIKPKL
jgi:hypothetical protein